MNSDLSPRQLETVLDKASESNLHRSRRHWLRQ
jgi:hypothetical protein